MAVCDRPNWARVGFVLRPFLIPLCWQKLFSIKSEFMYPGLILIPCPTDKLHKDKNPRTLELRSSLVSAVIKFFDGLNILQLVISFSQFLKYDKTSSSFFNLLSWRFVIGRLSRKILTRIEVFSSNSTVEANLAGLSSVPW
jgi:hypothetical protein